MLKIRIAEIKNFSEQVISMLQQIAIVDLIETEKSELKECFKQYDIFWFRLKYKIEDSDFSETVKCRFIICPVTGLDHIDLDACKRRGIKVISLKGETEFLNTIRATSEHTIGLTLALLRQLPFAFESVKKYQWNRDLFKGNEIYGKNVGIIGVGRLGSITAHYFKAFGANVFGYDINEFNRSICDHVNSLEELISIADIISVHVALQNSTRYLINANLFRKMKRTAILINTSRGAVINSNDLLQALQNKVIAGAALDVLENEYEISNNSLIDYAKNNSNLIITPHIGGNTQESFEKTEVYIYKKLENAISNGFK